VRSVSTRIYAAAELKDFLKDKMPNVKAFGGSYKQLTDKTAKMIQADLKEAGIDYKDNSGRYFDFHALRRETGTLLAAAGVHPKVAQSIMRHSDINLTMSLYTHTLRGQESEAVAKLPDLSQPSKQQKSQRNGTNE
jgi:integrase